MTFQLCFEIPGLPKSPNGAHGHWQKAAAERKKWRRMTQVAAMECTRPERPLVDVSLVITRYSSVAMDFDNRVAAGKSVRDGLRDAGIILDDTDKVILKQEYPQCKTKPGKGFMEVFVAGTVISETAWEEYLGHQKKLALKRLLRRTAAKKGAK